MSGEISVSLSGNVGIGTAPYNLSEQFPANGAVAYDSSTPLRDDVVMSVPASDTNITALLPNTAGIEGVLYVKNLDDTNYLEIGATASGAIAPLSRINPGRIAFIPLKPGITLRAQANAAPVPVHFRLYAGNSTSGA